MHRTLLSRFEIEKIKTLLKLSQAIAITGMGYLLLGNLNRPTTKRVLLNNELFIPSSVGSINIRGT